MTTLLQLWPALQGRLAWAPLGDWPTPITAGSGVVEQLHASGELWLKRDDLSSSRYGGSKLRLLEHLLAQARAQGASVVYSSGAMGSNFALATATHAPRVGLVPGAICFPQPLTPEGERSHRAVSALARVIAIPHWSLLPLASERVRRAAEEQGERAVVLSQVRLTPESLLGYVSAGLELATQVEQGLCPPPARVVLPIGSAATSAGLLAGLGAAKKLGIGRAPLPRVDAVRIAAWPLSRRARVLSLAERALRCLAQLSGDARLALDRRELPPLEVVTDQLGAGYPHPTAAGDAAQRAFADAGLAILDGTYSAKAAAHVAALLRRREPGPLLLWCTKSSAPSLT